MQQFKALEKANFLPDWFPNPQTDQGQRCMMKNFEFLKNLQYQRIGRLEGYEFENARLPTNESLNRYTDVYPFDKNRIILKGAQDYINASSLESLGGIKKYIIAQGPLPNTCADFWQMIWEQNSPLILMLTQESESRFAKCHRYWPNNLEIIKFANSEISFTIKSDSEEYLMNGRTIHRRFEILNNQTQETRTTNMIQFLEWPDHDDCCVSLVLELADIVNDLDDELRVSEDIGRLTVHCSAGCGRSATYCAIDSISYGIHNELSFQDERLVDLESGFHDFIPFPKDDYIFQTVNHFRKQRVSAVQSFVQLFLIYESVLDLLHKLYSQESSTNRRSNKNQILR